MNVEFIATDWGTVVQRRAMREPGSLEHLPHHVVGHLADQPAVQPDPARQRRRRVVRLAGGSAHRGPAHRLGRGADAEAQARVALEIQQRSFETVPLVPLGMWNLPQAVRRNLTGVVKGIVAVPWNVRRV